MLFDRTDRDTTFVSDGIRLRAAHFFTLPWDSRATDGSIWPESGGIIIRLAPMEYIVAGTGIVVTFDRPEASVSAVKQLGEDGFELAGSSPDGLPHSTTPARQRIGILSCDQVSVAPDGTLQYIRRLNGDQDHQGRHVRIGVDDYQILHVRLYEYR